MVLLASTGFSNTDIARQVPIDVEAEHSPDQAQPLPLPGGPMSPPGSSDTLVAYGVCSMRVLIVVMHAARSSIAVSRRMATVIVTAGAAVL